jgi:hypothetical protein
MMAIVGASTQAAVPDAMASGGNVGMSIDGTDVGKAAPPHDATATRSAVDATMERRMSRLSMPKP